MAQEWNFWLADLKEPQDRANLTDVGQGFWRHQAAKTRTDWPIAVWYEGAEPVIKVGQSVKRGQNALLEFLGGSTWLHSVAVSHADYKTAIDTGFWADDGKAAKNMDEAERMGIDIAQGDNAAPVDESLADQISALAEKLDKTVEPTTQEQANALSAMLDKMRTLLKLAEAERVKEKEPHLQASRDVDAKWKAIGEPGGNAYRDGDARRKSYLRKEQARLDAIAAEERRKKQAEIDAENDRIRAANAARAAEAEAQGNPLGVGVPLEPEISAPAVEAQRATAGGAFGRSTGLRKVTVVDQVDVAVLTQHFVETGDDDFKAYLNTRAAKAVRAKVKLPGVTTKEELQ